MILCQPLSFFFVLLFTLFFSTATAVKKSYDEKQVEVAMRMIGHEFLRKAGDSISRIMPITKSDERYKIEFDTDFSFEPDDLIETINDVIKETKIANTYIVEVEDCVNEEVVYSYGIDSAAQLNLLPCGGRAYPSACYSVLVTLKEFGVTYPMNQIGTANNIEERNGASSKLLFAACGLSLLLLGVFFFVKKRKKDIVLDPNIIAIGQYQFDKRNYSLSINGQAEELSGKEAELLQLLIHNKNETLERDTILKEVWGDEGDYIGRTLDVFISKLRKKLETDSNIKIVNIRGVGYKMVVEQ